MGKLRILSCIMASFGIFLSVTSALAAEGVTSKQIRIGQVCALTGPAQGLGKAMRAGAMAYFTFINDQGGVHGRQIQLITLDDGYEPKRTIAATKILLDQEKVFMLFGYVGTPTSKAAVPLAKRAKVPYFGPFTGAEFLRNPVNPYVYNVRASYFQETEAQVRELVEVLGKKKIAVFYQNDSYGRAGLGGVQKAMRKRDLRIVATGTYQRNTVAVQAAVSTIKNANPDAVIMIGAYKPCAAFIRSMRAAGMRRTLFLNVSFVGSVPLARELESGDRDVIVTQVVPLPWDTSVPLVRDYQEHMSQYVPQTEIRTDSYTFGFGSLEGYLNAKIVVEAIRRVGPNLTRSALLKALDGMSAVDVGGVTINFSPEDHQGMDTVYFTLLNQGRYEQIQSLKDR